LVPEQRVAAIPERRVGARIDREEQTAVAKLFIKSLAGDAGLDDAVEILGMHGKNLVHIAEIDRHAAGRRIDVPFERGADAIGNDRDAVFGADPHDLLHFFSALRENDGVGRLVCDPGDGIAVLLAHGLRRHHTISESRR
jgi:hypothetical protein